VRGLLANSTWKPGVRRKRNLLIPAALREKSCQNCGGDLWFPVSRGEKRKGLGRMWRGLCKTHLQNPLACPRTSIVFDKRGQEIRDLPRFAPRPFKKLNFDRPECPICKSPMKTGNRSRRMVSRGRKVREDTVQRLYCDGGRWGKPRHPLQTIYVNGKGGIEVVPRGKHKRISDLPGGLRENYPFCCNKPMARQARYKTVRSGLRIWYFRCHVCSKQQAFDEAGRRHEPYVFAGRKIRTCPDCGNRLVKARSSKTEPMLIRYTCKHYDASHTRSVWYFHRKNGRMYVLVKRGSRWVRQLPEAPEAA
jgi:hypothetical protein